VDAKEVFTQCESCMNIAAHVVHNIHHNSCPGANVVHVPLELHGCVTVKYCRDWRIISQFHRTNTVST
jgi:hypothetical protein